jgi:phosphoglycolate phosphatase
MTPRILPRKQKKQKQKQKRSRNRSPSPPPRTPESSPRDARQNKATPLHATQRRALVSRRLLLLFDIDGTLLDTAGAGAGAIVDAFQSAFGIPSDQVPPLDLAGATDSGLARDLLHRLDIPHNEENLRTFYEAYVGHLDTKLKQNGTRGRLLPGVHALLSALRDETTHLTALLTGNIQRGAFLKVTHYGIGEFFEFGAFGDDHHDRDELGPIAMRRAHDHHGLAVEAEEVVIIGDTPKDIRCARACGARAIAVATGSFSSSELEAHQPDHLFEDFTDTAAALSAIHADDKVPR